MVKTMLVTCSTFPHLILLNVLGPEGKLTLPTRVRSKGFPPERDTRSIKILHCQLFFSECHTIYKYQRTNFSILHNDSHIDKKKPFIIQKWKECQINFLWFCLCSVCSHTTINFIGMSALFVLHIWMICDLSSALNYFNTLFITDDVRNNKVFLPDHKRRTARGVSCPWRFLAGGGVGEGESEGEGKGKGKRVGLARARGGAPLSWSFPGGGHLFWSCLGGGGGYPCQVLGQGYIPPSRKGTGTKRPGVPPPHNPPQSPYPPQFPPWKGPGTRGWSTPPPPPVEWTNWKHYIP